MTQAPRIEAASAADLAHLAEALAPSPLFLAYDLSASALQRRWQSALAEGQCLQVARDSAGEPPRGLSWFAPSGTFASGAYLRLLAVVPEARGRTLGAALLAAYEDAARGARGGFFLLVSDFNGAAQRFYARHGYREVGRLPAFAHPAVTELIYWKPPPSPGG